MRLKNIHNVHSNLIGLSSLISSNDQEKINERYEEIKKSLNIKVL